MADEAVEVAGADLLAGGDAAVELLEHAARDLAGGLRPVEDDDVAVRMRLDAEPVLDQRQVAVKFPEQPRQMPVVLERHDDALVRSLHLSLGVPVPATGLPAKCCQIGSPDVSRFESSTSRIVNLS